MILDMGNRLGAGAAVLALALFMGCQAHEEPTSAATDASAEAEPATLGSMDEQYAWVGDLGDRDALPGKPLYIEHCAGSRSTGLQGAPHYLARTHVSAGAVSVDHRGHHAISGCASL